MDKLDGKSHDIVADNIERLRALFPEVFAEGKVDIDKLLLLLGDDIVEGKEKYAFTWKGKTDAIRTAQIRSSGTLCPDKAASVDWDTTQNLYIEGDNLEVLKLLTAAYHSTIKMIYIDPPYNTGNDFIYTDDFSDSIENYRTITGQQNSSNPDTSGRYHTNWLNLMYPRLKLAQVLLADEGLIFISIDDNEVENLKKLCNEVFGEDNFVCQFIWHSRQNVDSRSLNGASIDHEYVLCYSKCNTRLTGKEIDTDKYKNPDNDPRGPWMSSSMDGLATIELRPNLHYTIIDPATGKQYNPNPANGWRFQRSTVDTMIAEKRIIWPKNDASKPRFKRYLNEINSHFTGFSSLLKADFTLIGTKELRGLFDGMETLKFPKPISLIKTLIAQGTTKDDGDIVLDFFSGSATAAHAVMQLNAEDGGNRRYIMVQLPELIDENSEAFKAGYKTICDIGKERIRRAGKKIKDASPMTTAGLDIGFKVFKLDSTNLIIWDNTYSEDEEEVAKRILQQSLFYIKDGRDDLDLVTEIMLKHGRPLTDKITEAEVKGVKVYIIENPSYKILVCLQPNITLEAVEAMITGLPPIGTYIFADRCFADANDIMNTKEILKKDGRTMKLF